MQVNAKNCSFCVLKFLLVVYALTETGYKSYSKHIEVTLKMCCQWHAQCNQKPYTRESYYHQADNMKENKIQVGQETAKGSSEDQGEGSAANHADVSKP